MARRYWRLLTPSLGVAALLYGPSPALGQAYLGSNVIPFAILAGTPNVDCQSGPSLITGNVGISPAAAIVGFPAPCTLVGVQVTPPASDQAKLDLTTAYNTLAALPCAAPVGPNLAGLTLTQGVYCLGAAASNLTGTLTLDAQGIPNAVWVFQMSSSLITSSGSTVSVINGGNPCGVQWQVGSSATIGSGTTFVGNILALTSITLNSGTNLTGRALARNGAVTLNATNISFAACGAGGGAGGAPPPFTAPGVPTLPPLALWLLAAALAAAGLALLRRRSLTQA